MKNILITGGAGFIGSHLVKHFVKKYKNYNIINIDKLTYASNLSFLNEINAFENYYFLYLLEKQTTLRFYVLVLLLYIIDECNYFVVAIGSEYGKARFLISNELLKHKLKPLNLIDNNSIIAHDVFFGKGFQSEAGSIIQNKVNIGDFCILNTNASIDHHSNIGNGCHIMPGATIAGKVVPMMCGSAFKNKGVQTMLDMVMEILPSPLDIEAISGIDPVSKEEISRKPSVSEPFSSLAFKIATDPFVGRLCFTRAYSGKLTSGSYVYNTRTNKKERISRIFQMHANKQNQIPSLDAGDIGALVGFKDIKTGDTLCDEKKHIILESMDFPDPVIGLAIEPKTQADVDKLGIALSKLSEEDPTFQVKTDEDSGQTIISGMGELHLDIIIDRLRREFKVECNQGAPQVAYKEAISTGADHREVYKKQSGGRGKFADIVFKIEPGDAENPGLIF